MHFARLYPDFTIGISSASNEISVEVRSFCLRRVRLNNVADKRIRSLYADDNITSRKLANMSFLCAVLVVAIHIPEPEIKGTFAWWLVHLLQNVFGCMSVPFFFVVSGCMLAGHMEENGWYAKEMSKRVRSLLIPYLAWNCLFVIHLMPLSIVADIVAHRPFGTNLHCPTITAITGWKFWHFPAINALWYIRCLICLCVVSPLLLYFIKRYRRWFVLVLFICSIAVFEFVGGGTDASKYNAIQRFIRWGVSPWGVFYFSIGMAIRLGYICDVGKKWRRLICCVAVLFILQKLTYPYTDVRLPYRIGYLGTPFILYFTWVVVPNCKWPTWMTKSAFTMYVTHMFFISDFGILFRCEMTKEMICLGSFAFAVIGSIILSNCIHRLTPKIAKLLLAGR